jgi:hypothetical protein
MPQPYNSLGQILAAGGEKYAANLSSQGLAIGVIIGRLSKAYPRVAKAEIESLAILGSDMVRAANQIKSLPPDQPISIGDVPINVGAGSSWTEGIGYKVLVGWPDSATGNMRMMEIFTTELPSMDTIYKSTIDAQLEKYPGEFGTSDGIAAFDLSVFWIESNSLEI